MCGGEGRTGSSFLIVLIAVAATVSPEGLAFDLDDDSSVHHAVDQGHGQGRVAQKRAASRMALPLALVAGRRTAALAVFPTPKRFG
jgi:hypothetical protein